MVTRVTADMLVNWTQTEIRSIVISENTDRQLGRWLLKKYQNIGYRLKHIQHFTEINKLCKVASFISSPTVLSVLTADPRYLSDLTCSNSLLFDVYRFWLVLSPGAFQVFCFVYIYC
jgi:hypothetical protein